MPSRRNLLCAALPLPAISLPGCVATNVTSQPLQTGAPRAERLLVVVRMTGFATDNTAARLGQQNLSSLVPNLVARLPVVLTKRGMPTRAVLSVSSDAALHASLRPETAERVLILSPESASYSSKTGQELYLNAQLLDAGPLMLPVWRARIRMGTLGFGKFDDKVADEVANQLLERLQNDRMARTLVDGLEAAVLAAL